MIQQLLTDLAHFRSEMLMSRYNKARATGDKIIKMLDTLSDVGLDRDEMEKLRNQILIELKLCSEIEKMISEEKNSDMLNFRRRSRDQKSAGSTKKSLSSGRRQFRSKEIKTTKKSPEHKITQYVSSTQEKTTQSIGKWGRSKRTKSQASENPVNTFGSLQMANSAKLQLASPDKQLSPQKKPIQTIKEEQQSEQMCKMGRDEAQLLQRQLILPINMPQFFKNTETKRFIICYYKKCADLLKKIDRQIKIQQVVEMDFLSQYQTLQQKSPNKIGYTVFVSPFTTNDKQIIIKILEQQNAIVVLYAQTNRMILIQKPSTIRHPDYNIQF